MRITLKERFLLIERDEKDRPAVPEPYPRPAKVTPAEFNSWRKEYRLSFDTHSEAEAAAKKVAQIGDFDKASAWLDKQ